MADDELSLIGDDKGWNRASVLPLAQRPIPYAGALAPRLAMPEFLAGTARMADNLLSTPGRVVSGKKSADAETAAAWATDLLMLGSGPAPFERDTMGLVRGWKGMHSMQPVEHDPWELVPVDHNPFEGAKAPGVE